MITAPSVGHQPPMQYQENLNTILHFTQDSQVKDYDNLGLYSPPLSDTPIKPNFPSHPLVGVGEHIEAGAFPTGFDEVPKREGHHMMVQAHKRRPRQQEDMLEDITENLTPDVILDAEDKIKDALEPVNKPFEGIEKDIEHDVDTLAEDIFP